MKEKEYIKEINNRRAASSNNDLVTRDFIPSQYHYRYMVIKKRAAEMRAADSSLKTQLRWGDRDIKIFMKTKGSQEQYMETDLKEFMGKEELPDCDLYIRWTLRKDIRPSRKLNNCNRTENSKKRRRKC